MNPLMRSLVLAYIILDLTELAVGALRTCTRVGAMRGASTERSATAGRKRQPLLPRACKCRCRPLQAGMLWRGAHGAKPCSCAPTSAGRQACSGSCSCRRYCMQSRTLRGAGRGTRSQVGAMRMPHAHTCAPPMIGVLSHGLAPPRAPPYLQWLSGRAAVNCSKVEPGAPSWSTTTCSGRRMRSGRARAECSTRAQRAAAGARVHAHVPIGSLSSTLHASVRSTAKQRAPHAPRRRSCR